MQTICNYAVRCGVIDVNPFVGLMLNETDVVRRDVTASQVTRFTWGPSGKTSPSRRWGARPCSPISPDFVRLRFARFTVQEFGTTA